MSLASRFSPGDEQLLRDKRSSLKSPREGRKAFRCLLGQRNSFLLYGLCLCGIQCFLSVIMEIADVQRLFFVLTEKLVNMTHTQSELFVYKISY